jgi:branched-chain amino acid transport system substrate-binding protein
MGRIGRRTRFVALLLPASLAALGLACESPRAVVLGVSTSPPYVDAARLAIEDELAAGPVRGFDTVMIPQAENLASPAIDAARRLVERAGLIAVVGHSNSAASLATAPIYNAHQVVQIAPTASATAYSEAGPYSFRLVPPDDEQGRFLAERVREILPDGGRLALVYVNDDYGRGLRASLRAVLDAQRYAFVHELPQLESATDDEDAAYAADALGDARPDLIVWLARGALLARFLGGMRERLPDVPILGGDGVGTGGLERVPRAVMGDVRFVAYLDLDATEVLRTFTRRYRERFGRDASASAALTYDAVRLAIAGIRTGARTGPDLRAYLSALGRSSPAYLGIAGPVVFDDDGDVQRPYVLMRGGSEDGR